MALVSICLPNLNTQPYLEARLESIFKQTMPDWELIVCDSHSSDGSWELFQKYQNDRRVRLYQVPREGLFAGWNECLKRVTGKFVYIATSDDTAYPDLLSSLVGLLERNPEDGVAMGQFDFINHHGNVIPPTQGLPGDFFGEWRHKLHRRSGWIDFLVHTQIGTSWTSITSALFRADVVKQAGYFRTDFGRGEAFGDRFWAMKIASLASTIYTPEKVATWRVHPAQASSAESPGWRIKNLRITEETIRECEGSIPDVWKDDPQWMPKLLFGMRQYYLQGYGLDRKCMKTEPRRFVRGLGRAILHEPAYLGRRLASGLSWESDEMRNVNEVVRGLIKDWRVPWPPESMESHDDC